MNILTMGKNTDAGSLRVQVFQMLETAILSGEYKDGDSLNEIKIAQTLGVSRTPVREALMQLELEGLAKNIPNKGAVVIGISEKDIDDIYAIRIRVEGLAARLCAENMSENDLKALEKIVDLQEFYLMKFDISPLWQLDGEFHKIIYSCSNNRPLRSMLTTYHNYIQRARDIMVRSKGRAQKSVAEHRSILEAIRLHDGDKAEEYMTRHIINARNVLHEKIESGELE
jgi:DNA-binding GntR family transcriptional regulator